MECVFKFQINRLKIMVHMMFLPLKKDLTFHPSRPKPYNSNQADIKPKPKHRKSQAIAQRILLHRNWPWGHHHLRSLQQFRKQVAQCEARENTVSICDPNTNKDMVQFSQGMSGLNKMLAAAQSGAANKMASCALSAGTNSLASLVTGDYGDSCQVWSFGLSQCLWNWIRLFENQCSLGSVLCKCGGKSSKNFRQRLWKMQPIWCQHSSNESGGGAWTKCDGRYEVCPKTAGKNPMLVFKIPFNACSGMQIAITLCREQLIPFASVNTKIPMIPCVQCFPS